VHLGKSYSSPVRLERPPRLDCSPRGSALPLPVSTNRYSARNETRLDTLPDLILLGMNAASKKKPSTILQIVASILMVAGALMYSL